MSFNYEDWSRTMRRKFGDEWKAEMRSRASAGGKVRTEKGMAKLSPERRAEISRLGVEARRRNVAQQP